MMKPAVLFFVCLAVVCAACGKRYVGKVTRSDGGADAPAEANTDGDTDASPDILPDILPDLPDTGAIDARDGGVIIPGTIAWTAMGRPVSDGTARFYTRHEDPGGGHFWRIDPETGQITWQIYEAVDFICFGGPTALFADVNRGIVGADAKRVLVRSSDTGSPVWQGTLTRPIHFSCWQGFDRFFAVETLANPVLTAYRTSVSQMLWSVPAAAETTVDAVTPETTYVSSYASGRTRLDALRSADGAPLWNVSFTSTQKLSFVFDAQRNLYAIDGSPGSSSLQRLSPDGGPAPWSRSLSDGSKVVIDGSSDFLLVKEAGTLRAIDKATGAERWPHTPDPAGGFASWEATFLRSGDVLVTSTEAQIRYQVLAPDGAIRSLIGPHTFPGRNGQQLFESAGELYVVMSRTVSRLDPSLNAASLWTFRDEPIDRVIGSDEELVLVAGPEIGCRPCFEQVLAIDKRDGRLMWKVPGQLPSQNALWATDAKRIYLSVPYGERYVPGTVTAIWK
jgi:hypothetical protein